MWPGLLCGCKLFTELLSFNNYCLVIRQDAIKNLLFSWSTILFMSLPDLVEKEVLLQKEEENICSFYKEQLVEGAEKVQG